MEFTFIYLTDYPFLNISVIGAVPTDKSNKLITYATYTQEDTHDSLYGVSAICHYVESSDVPVIWTVGTTLHRAMLFDINAGKVRRNYKTEHTKVMLSLRWRKQLEMMNYSKLLSITG